MILQLYILLFATALLGTAAIIWMGSSGGVASVSISPRAGILISAAVFVLWGLLGIESFEIIRYSGGQQFSQSYEELAWFSLAGALVAFLSMIQATLEEIKNTGGI